MEKTIEQKAAQTILQEPEVVSIGGKTYNVAPPSVATLILVSAGISRLPHIRLDEKRVAEEVLSVAKDCRELGNIAATLILGAKQVNEIVEKRRGLWGFLGTRRTVKRRETKMERLSRELLEETSPRDLHNMIAQLLMKMQVSDFFGLTTFLTGINLMRPTKVGTEATASGQ